MSFSEDMDMGNGGFVPFEHTSMHTIEGFLPGRDHGKITKVEKKYLQHGNGEIS